MASPAAALWSAPALAADAWRRADIAAVWCGTVAAMTGFAVAGCTGGLFAHSPAYRHDGNGGTARDRDWALAAARLLRSLRMRARVVNERERQTLVPRDPR
jgi:hypothetical protein